MKSKEDVELQGDRQANDCSVEEELEAKKEPTTSICANDVHDEDNESLNDRQGSAVRSTCEEPANASHNEASDGTHRLHVDGNLDNQSLDGTHEEPVGGSRDDQFPDDTRDNPVFGSHEKSDEGMRKKTVGSTCEDLGGGTREETISSTSGHPVPGSHGEPLNNDNDEATVTGTSQDSSSHHEHQSPSESQPDRPRYRGKPK